MVISNGPSRLDSGLCARETCHVYDAPISVALLSGADPIFANCIAYQVSWRWPARGERADGPRAAHVREKDQTVSGMISGTHRSACLPALAYGDSGIRFKEVPICQRE